MLTNYVYKLRQNQTQELKMSNWVDMLRSHFNWCLNDRITQYSQQFIQGNYCDIRTQGEACPLTSCVSKNGARTFTRYSQSNVSAVASLQAAVAGPSAFVRSYLLKGGFRDGSAGFMIAKFAARHASLKHKLLMDIQRSCQKPHHKGGHAA